MIQFSFWKYTEIVTFPNFLAQGLILCKFPLNFFLFLSFYSLDILHSLGLPCKSSIWGSLGKGRKGQICENIFLFGYLIVVLYTIVRLCLHTNSNILDRISFGSLLVSTKNIFPRDKYVFVSTSF